jgi:hypothetical protein
LNFFAKGVAMSNPIPPNPVCESKPTLENGRKGFVGIAPGADLTRVAGAGSALTALLLPEVVRSDEVNDEDAGEMFPIVRCSFQSCERAWLLEIARARIVIPNEKVRDVICGFVLWSMDSRAIFSSPETLYPSIGGGPGSKRLKFGCGDDERDGVVPNWHRSLRTLCEKKVLLCLRARDFLRSYALRFVAAIALRQ